MSDSKKPDESKKDAATSEEKGELSMDDLDKVAGGVLNLGNAAAVKQLGTADAAKVAPVRFDPGVLPKGGSLE